MPAEHGASGADPVARTRRRSPTSPARPRRSRPRPRPDRRSTTRTRRRARRPTPRTCRARPRPWPPRRASAPRPTGGAARSGVVPPAVSRPVDSHAGTCRHRSRRSARRGGEDAAEHRARRTAPAIRTTGSATRGTERRTAMRSPMRSRTCRSRDRGRRTRLDGRSTHDRRSVRLLTPTTRNANEIANVVTFPISAMAEEAATASSPSTNTRRSCPRSRIGPVAIVLSPPSSQAPMIPVSVPVVVEKARSSVGRNGPTHRSAVFETTLAPVSTASSTSWVRSADERGGRHGRHGHEERWVKS